MTTATKARKGNAIKTSVEELLDALDAVVKAVPARGPKPVLANVRLGDGVMSGTDLEVRIDTAVPFHCEPVLLPAARLHAILRSCRRDAEVTITTQDSMVTIAAGGGRWDMPTESAAEFPMWEAANAKPIARLPADQFVRAVRAVAYAADNESSRFALGAVLVDVSGGNPTFVATDGRRLSSVQTETDQAVDDSTTLIPSRAIKMMATLAAGSADSVQLEATASEVICTVGDHTLTARLTEGRFPKWRDVFPERKNTPPTTIEVASLSSAVQAAAICTSEQSLGVQFYLGSVLKLTSQSSEAGQASVTCDVTKEGKAATVKLNPRYVLDFLNALGAEDEPHVEIEVDGPGDAVVLKCDDIRGVIMPLAEDA